MTESVERNVQIQKSVFQYLCTQLYDVRGFSRDDLQVEESFDYERFTEALDKTYLSLGFNFDDGGVLAEMGSSLIRRVITIEAFVFGLTNEWADTIVGAVQRQLWADQAIPLLDIGSSDTPAIIDYLFIPDRGSVRGERVPVRDPRPWEKYLQRIVVKVEDEAYAASLL